MTDAPVVADPPAAALAILLDSVEVLALPWNILTVPVAEVLIALLPADVIVMSLPAVVSPASRLEPALTVIENAACTAKCHTTVCPEFDAA